MVQLRSTSTFSWFTTLVNKIALLIAFCVMGSSSLFAQTITHFGGTPGTAGYGGDGGPATMALMERPTGIAVDGAGNVYIADSKNNCIRMVATNGDITTIAGNGNIPGGDDGDDLPATDAKLREPTDVAVATNGNVYIADMGNHKIRKIDYASGKIFTIAGTGTAGYGGDGGPATMALFNRPTGICLNPQNDILYIADNANNRIRKVKLDNGKVYPVAGAGTAGYGGDGGPATMALFNHPFDITTDGNGNVYIADTKNNRIRKFVNATNKVIPIAGDCQGGYGGDGGPAGSVKLNNPTSIDFYDNKLFFADQYNNRIRKIDFATDMANPLAGNGILGRSGDGGTALSAELDEPNSICMTGDKLYISDWGNDYVRIIDFNANNSGFMSNIDINFIEQSGENTLAVPNLGSNTYITLLDSRKHLIFVKKLKDRRVTLRGIYKGKYKVIISDKGKFAGSKTIEIK